MELTIETIKKYNLTVGEVLEDKINEGNTDALDKILANFIRLNIVKVQEDLK